MKDLTSVEFVYNSFESEKYQPAEADEALISKEPLFIDKPFPILFKKLFSLDNLISPVTLPVTLPSKLPVTLPSKSPTNFVLAVIVVPGCCSCNSGDYYLQLYHLNCQ